MSDKTIIKKKTLFKILIMVAIAALAIILGKKLDIDLSKITPQIVREWILSFGNIAPIVYIISYSIRPLILFPAALLTIVSGLAFGPIFGTIFTVIGATLCALIEFVIARYLGREFVEKLIKGKIANLDEKIQEHGLKISFLIRLIPNAPFDVQNLSLGLTKMKFSHFFVGTIFGIIPGTFAFVYFGYSLSDFRQVWKIFLAAFLITLVFIAQKYYKKRKARIDVNNAE